MLVSSEIYEPQEISEALWLLHALLSFCSALRIVYELQLFVSIIVVLHIHEFTTYSHHTSKKSLQRALERCKTLSENTKPPPCGLSLSSLTKEPWRDYSKWLVSHDLISPIPCIAQHISIFPDRYVMFLDYVFRLDLSIGRKVLFSLPINPCLGP